MTLCGPTGSGKTTYSIALCQELEAIRFSIDPWMHTLYAKDMTSLDYAWMMERVSRCCEQIWEVSEQILKLNGNVVLDLGFTTKAQRDLFANRAKQLQLEPELHYLSASMENRKQRVHKRNTEKDPAVYSFEVTDMMFDFMEPRFEVPDQTELSNGRLVED